MSVREHTLHAGTLIVALVGSFTYGAAITLAVFDVGGLFKPKPGQMHATGDVFFAITLILVFVVFYINHRYEGGEA